MNPHQKPQEDVVVTQEDIDAALMLDDALGFLTEIERPIVEQHLARHRLLGYEAGRRDMREAAGKVADLATFGCEITETDHKGWPTTPAGAARHTGLYIAQQIRLIPTDPLGGESLRDNSGPE